VPLFSGAFVRAKGQVACSRLGQPGHVMWCWC